MRSSTPMPSGRVTKEAFELTPSQRADALARAKEAIRLGEEKAGQDGGEVSITVRTGKGKTEG
jgi:hypothetical protein